MIRHFRTRFDKWDCQIRYLLVVTVDVACRPPGRGPGGVSGSVLNRRNEEVAVTGLVA
jgi:hypothetical protein